MRTRTSRGHHGTARHYTGMMGGWQNCADGTVGSRARARQGEVALDLHRLDPLLAAADGERRLEGAARDGREVADRRPAAAPAAAAVAAATGSSSTRVARPARGLAPASVPAAARGWWRADTTVRCFCRRPIRPTGRDQWRRRRRARDDGSAAIVVHGRDGESVCPPRASPSSRACGISRRPSAERARPPSSVVGELPGERQRCVCVFRWKHQPLVSAGQTRWSSRWRRRATAQRAPRRPRAACTNRTACRRAPAPPRSRVASR